MKRLLTIAALALASSSFVSGQAADAKKPQAGAAAGNVEKTLMQIEHDATAAIIKKDAAAVGRFLADDYVFTPPDGTVQTKAQLLADLKGNGLVIDSSDISDMKVKVLGDAAIVTYTTTDKGKYKGQDISGKYRWLDVFAHRGGRWLLVAAQGTKIAQ